MLLQIVAVLVRIVLLLSQGSGANVTIPNGQVSMVYLDGAGSGAAVVDALTDLSIAGTFNAAADIVAAGTLQAAGDTAAGDDAAIGFYCGRGFNSYRSRLYIRCYN